MHARDSKPTQHQKAYDFFDCGSLPSFINAFAKHRYIKAKIASKCTMLAMTTTEYKSITHLNNYPVFQISKEFAYKFPLVKPTRDLVGNGLDRARGNETLNTVINAADNLGNDALNMFDWYLAWIRATTTNSEASDKAEVMTQQVVDAEEALVNQIKEHLPPASQPDEVNQLD